MRLSVESKPLPVDWVTLSVDSMTLSVDSERLLLERERVYALRAAALGREPSRPLDVGAST
jgi:hypothetical protein